ALQDRRGDGGWRPRRADRCTACRRPGGASGIIELIMSAIGKMVADLTLRFAAAGIDNPRLDARVLIGHVLELPPEELFARSEDAFPADRVAALDAIVVRRLRGEPVSRIRGFREFYGLEFLIGPATLDPRPDTETLVNAALHLRMPGRP